MTGAAAVVFDADGRLLLIKENYDRRRWSFPGGAVEAGETPADAALRELAEETGATGSIDATVGVYQLVDGLEVHLFASTDRLGHAPVPEGDEIAEVAWLDIAAIPEPRSNILHHALPDVVAGARNVERRGLESLN